MKSLKIFSIIWLAAMLVLGLGFEAQAAKSIVVGTATVNNTDSEALRTKDLPITLKGGFNDANGLAFTLVYNKDIFDFVGLVQNTTTLYDGSTYDSNPPDAATAQGIADSNIVFMANNRADQGRVLISAAAAHFLAATTADVIPFKARFRAKVGQGSGTYPVNLQQTIIGPDTAAAAGYNTLTSIPVAVGLDPAAPPTTATSFAVSFVSGSITVSGGYSINGIVQYQGGTPANGATVQLFKKVDGVYGLNATTLVSSGNFSFANKPAGIYKLVVLSSNPSYQRRYESADLTVPPAYNAGTITLAAYSPLVGQITVNGAPIAGVKAKVMQGSTLIGSFSVDANGNFVTPPLEPPLTNYTLTAVYGSAESAAFTGTTNWTLPVGTLSGSVSGLTDGQNVMLHIVSASAQLEKTLNKTAAGDVPYQFTNLLPATDYIVSIVGDGIPVSYYKVGENMGVSDIMVATPLTVAAGPPGTLGIDFNFAALTTRTIAGTVSKNSTGQTGVPVFALETSTFEMYSVFSGNGGLYTLTVKDGTYIVFAFNNGKTFYYNAGGTTQVEAEADAVEVTGNVPGININLDEQNGVITGQVTYRRLGGDPVAGIMVTAAGPRGNAVAVTNASGNYTLSGLYNEPHTVTIYPPSPYPRQTASVTAAPAGTVQNFVIHTGWVFSGTVTSDADASPINGAWIYLINSSGNIQGIPAFSNAGAFTLADIPAGVYTLKAEHPDYRPISVSLEIQADISGYSLALIPGGSISGTVTDEVTTNPLANVMIIASAVGETARYAFTNSFGAYALNGLVNSSPYFLRVSKQGYLTQLVQETATASTVRHFILQQPANKYNFSGTVTDGTPIVGAIVVVSSASKNFSASTVTVAGGVFSFSQLIAAADYKIVVLPGNNRPVHIEPTYNHNAEKLDYVITIPTGSISGTITLNDAATGKDVTVYLIDAAGNYVTDVTAANAGGGAYTYSFSGVQAAADFKVVAYAPGYGIRWFDGAADFASATAVQSGDTEVNIALAP